MRSTSLLCSRLAFSRAFHCVVGHLLSPSLLAQSAGTSSLIGNRHRSIGRRHPERDCHPYQ